MKSVAIIGAGPAGLVTAKTLLRASRADEFQVTVFEKSSRLGGIWALDELSTSQGFLSAHTPTNLSQFQVSFSDLAWQSVDCSPSATETADGGADSTVLNRSRHDAPMFPKAWQAGQYLRAYAQKYIPTGAIQYNTEVLSTSRIFNGESHVWEIATDGGAGKQTHVFDRLVVASGFFSKPRVPSQALDPFQGAGPIKMIHTSQFRNLQDLFPEPAAAKGKKILIFGGGNSVGETSGTVAFALSSERNTSAAGAERFAGCHIVQVIPRPLYALPPFIPSSEDQTGFVPIDCRFYDLASRPPEEIVSNAGRMSLDSIKFMHGGARKYVGGDQADLGSEALTVKDAFAERTLQASLTENYAEFVRSSDITSYAGRVIKIETQPESQLVRALVQTGDQETWIEDVGAVVHATGYTPHEAVAFLPDTIKQTLEYDPTSTRLPLILDEMQTINRDIPELGFVGFYEGPYWGMMEMQARLITQRWLGKLDCIERPSESKEKLRSLRQGMVDRDWDVPQYWLGDYVGHMEHFSRDLRLERNDHPFSGPRDGVLLPSRFVDGDTDMAEANLTMQKVFDTIQASKKGAFVSRAAARALQGNWSLHRRIESMTADFPSGTFEGIARFHPRMPTDPGSDQPFDLEFLYVEQGAFVADTGLTFQASRSYVYRYREADDHLSVWFVKDDGYTADYLFHNLAFSPPPGLSGIAMYVAKAEHLCVKDMYKTQYEFDFNGFNIRGFRSTHAVKGPKKDYVSTSQYERPSKDPM